MNPLDAALTIRIKSLELSEIAALLAFVDLEKVEPEALRDDGGVDATSPATTPRTD